MDSCDFGVAAVVGLRSAVEPGNYAESRGVPNDQVYLSLLFHPCNLADNMIDEDLGLHAKLGSYACTGATPTRTFCITTSARVIRPREHGSPQDVAQ